VKLTTDLPFLGREAAASEAGPLSKMLACFTVDDPGIVLHGRETILRDGEAVGWLASGGWGYTVGANIGYGYVRGDGGVDRAYLEQGSYELEVARERAPCRLRFGPLYDPGRKKINV
jgi:4-methylaminobutanoate oxidase (formaldehyde-forming)